MTQQKTTFINREVVGLIAGIIVPAITSYLIYYHRYPGEESYFELIKALFVLESVGKLLSLSVLPNLLVFFAAVWSDMLKAARGVLTATVVYTILGVILFVSM
ncbi:hypothetical protein QA597_10725 [Marinilabiliaceae bacterium ANBcel2]|nr:hypothetical protein [Marinilabiliaceae bacterium ANBcel2]